MFNNQKQTIPEVFKLIMEVDRAIDECLNSPILQFEEIRDLHRQRKSLSRDAERILRWNTDKGNHP